MGKTLNVNVVWTHAAIGNDESVRAVMVDERYKANQFASVWRGHRQRKWRANLIRIHDLAHGKLLGLFATEADAKAAAERKLGVEE